MSQSAKCPECGAPLPANSPEGLCRACLLRRGLETNTVGYTHEARAPWTPPTVAELAAHFPELDIQRLIGRGGMGAVYQARQKNLDRTVALKILPPAMAMDAAFTERFAREAQAMAKLNHPHIVTIYEFGHLGARATSPALSASAQTPAAVTSDLYYFLMEYVDGVNLRGLLDSGHISPKEALAIVPQICEALQYAHDQGIVHRDIKPENILLNKQGQVKIADFGLAKLMGVAGESRKQKVESRNEEGEVTVAGSVMGTPQYMAPEQKDHPAEVDHRADIYSLGVVFYQMLTGELPTGSFEPPSRKVHIDVRLDEIVLRALEKEPERRYQHASEVKTQVDTIAAGPAAPGAGASPTARERLSVCFLSTPEHLRSFRGRYLSIYQAKGELALGTQNLQFRSPWPTVTIPLDSIRKLGRGQFPPSAKPVPLQFIAVTYSEHGQERALLLTPLRAELMSPWEANKLSDEWLQALQEAVRTRTGRTLAVDHFELPQDRFWVLKTFLLAAAACTIAFSLIPLILEQRLPNQFSEFIDGLATAGLTMILLLGLRWWRQRKAIAAAESVSAATPLQPPGLSGTEESPTSERKHAINIDTTLQFGEGPGARQWSVKRSIPLGERLSRTAIVGIAWITLFFAAVPAFLAHESATHDFQSRGPFASPLAALIYVGIIFPAFLAPFGATILGLFAVSQIRHSAGRLYGLGLAVADFLFFPLVILGGAFAAVASVVLYILRQQDALPPELAPFALLLIPTVTVIAIIAIDLLIIRRVWRAVNKPLAGATSAHQTTPPLEVPPAAAPEGVTVSAWCRIVSLLLGTPFTSRLAIRLTNLSALGFLGFLAFLAFVPIPGMHRCLGFSGFFGFFGLIGFAVMVEMAAQRKARRSSGQHESTGTPFGPGRQLLLVLGGALLALVAAFAVWRMVVPPSPGVRVLTADDARQMGVSPQALPRGELMPSPEPSLPKTPDGKADVTPLERAAPNAQTTMRPLAPLPAPAQLPGTALFHARYQHRSGGRDIPEPSELWVNRTPDGGIAAMAKLPALQTVELILGDQQNRPVAYQVRKNVAPEYGIDLQFAPGSATFSRRGIRQDVEQRPLTVPADAIFDPNSRPDSYAAANVLLRRFAFEKVGEVQEIRVFDWDNTGENLVDYTIRVEFKGIEKVQVPAGTFDARHLTLTQTSSADTWFKKRQGHTTDFWLLDSGIIVRVLRHREPYEMLLLDYDLQTSLPGRMPTPTAASTQPATESAAQEAARLRLAVADRPLPRGGAITQSDIADRGESEFAATRLRLERFVLNPRDVSARGPDAGSI